VKDKRGWVHVVRGALADTAVSIVHAVYGPSRLKVIEKGCASGVAPAAHLHAWHEGDDCDLLLGPRFVRSVIPRHGLPLASVARKPQLLSDIDAMLARCRVSAFLFGSRRLRVHHPGSDWDLILNIPRNGITPGQVVASLAAESGGRLRRFTASECRARAGRYHRGHRISLDCLSTIFERSTPYLRSHTGEIGVFFTSDSDSLIPRIAREASKSPRSLDGTILPAAGESFLMPRRVRVGTPDGVVTVISVLWFMGGIEELAGSLVRMTGLYRLSDDAWWMGGQTAAIHLP
jgi:hypothetical protein